MAGLERIEEGEEEEGEGKLGEVGCWAGVEGDWGMEEEEEGGGVNGSMGWTEPRRRREAAYWGSKGSGVGARLRVLVSDWLVGRSSYGKVDVGRCGCWVFTCVFKRFR